jgi:hypothetical protein
MRIKLALSVLILILYANSAFAKSDYASRFENALHESSLKTRSIGELVIENKRDGVIYFTRTDGSTKRLGRVIMPSTEWSTKPFEASEWAPEGVCATAVNAIHLKQYYNADGDAKQTRLVSILPLEMMTVDPSKNLSYYNQSASVYTDIKAGDLIFGGLYTPFRGSIVKYSSEDIPLEIRIDFQIPDPIPLYVSFENRFGGKIQIKYRGQEPLDAGIVYKPVYGVGRFTGSTYCHVGRIRAAHSGVVCVSTSPFGEIGGFQIIPHFHADTTTVRNVRLLTQWMVIGPIDPNQKDYGLLPDLFSFIEPRYIEFNRENIDAGLSPLLARFHVVGKFKSSDEWTNFPPLVDRVDDALENLEMIRIYFPNPETFNDL